MSSASCSVDIRKMCAMAGEDVRRYKPISSGVYLMNEDAVKEKAAIPKGRPAPVCLRDLQALGKKSFARTSRVALLRVQNECASLVGIRRGGNISSIKNPAISRSRAMIDLMPER